MNKRLTLLLFVCFLCLVPLPLSAQVLKGGILEPTTIVLLGIGIVGVAGIGRNRITLKNVAHSGISKPEPWQTKEYLEDDHGGSIVPQLLYDEIAETM